MFRKRKTLAPVLENATPCPVKAGRFRHFRKNDKITYSHLFILMKYRDVYLI
jgi:hypothetical protein